MHNIFPLPPIDHDGWLTSATRLPSPFQDERPHGTAIDTIILHNISLPPGEFATPYIDALFLGTLPTFRHHHPYLDAVADLRVSAHFYIARDGHIRQYASIYRRAWHAGISHFRGRDQCNNFSVGIEIAGSDHHPYTLKQYQALAALIAILFTACPALTPDRITTHQHVSPTRKTDPGPAFNHAYLRRLLASHLSPTA